MRNYIILVIIMFMIQIFQVKVSNILVKINRKDKEESKLLNEMKIHIPNIN